MGPALNFATGMNPNSFASVLTIVCANQFSPATVTKDVLHLNPGDTGAEGPSALPALSARCSGQVHGHQPSPGGQGDSLQAHGARTAKVGEDPLSQIAP